MSRERQFWIWLVILVGVIGIVFVTSSVLLPFVAGMAVAYFLDPLADRLEGWGCSRWVATTIITVAFFAVVVLLLILLFPLLQGQVVSLATKLPDLVGGLTSWLEPFRDRIATLVPAEQMEELRSATKSFAGSIITWFGSVVQRIWQGGLAVFNLLSLVLITPIVSFYMLRDWDRIVAKIDGWLPRRSADDIRMVMGEIDTTVAGFVRGQGTVCLFLAAFYGIGLTLVGLDFGLSIGLATGLISFIPYFGMLIGMVIAFAVAFAQFSDLMPFVLVAVVFGAGQVIESMFLTPKLVGDRVGLHPVWVIFALLAGGALFGFTGVLLAVPVAATVGVLVRYFIRKYLESDLYGGERDSSAGSGI